MEKLRAGLIGAGGISRAHAETLRVRPDVELVAAADVSEKALLETATRFNIQNKYEDFHQMLSEQALDFVIVCTPTGTHAEATISALEAGCHVLCEKPPAMNVMEAARMAMVAGQNQKRLFYGLQRRFMGNVQAARRYAEQGRLGEIYHATAQWFRRRGIPGLGSWFTTKSVAGAGALYDIGVHMLDVSWYLMGQPRPVTCSAVTHCRFGSQPEKYNYLNMWGTRVPGGICDVEDMGIFMLRFDNGASLMLQVSWAANTREGVDVRVMGDRGGIMLGQADELTILTEDNGFIADIHPQLKKDNARHDMFEHFIDCIRHPEKPLMTDGAQGVVLQAMLDAVEQSAARGREVEVEIPALVND